jgi:hypothetical protein
MPSVTLFAGPSTHGIDAATLLAGGVALRSPARRSDIDRLLAGAREPGVIVLCDGIFHAHPAVSHAELCRALDAGWQIWGVSSLGAIRAFELRHEGMRGYGYVYAQFERHVDFTDDETCLLHFPEAPYFAVSEPLVNLRYALEARGASLGISQASADEVLSAMKSLWFGDRTPEAMREALGRAGVVPDRADELMHWLSRHRVKEMDLVRLMAERPWLGRAGRDPPSARADR